VRRPVIPYSPEETLDADTIRELDQVCARRRRTYRLMLAWPILAGLSAIPYAGYVTLPLFLASWVTIVYGVIMVNTTFCPRCKRALFCKGLWQSSFSDICVNCGVPIVPERRVRSR